MENGSNGFAFSQDLNYVFSQGSQDLGATQDQTWYSENNSQTTSGPNLIGSAGDQEISRPSLEQPLTSYNQSVPAKKAKYSQPKWAKGLLKTAEENQRQKDIENMMKRQEEDSRFIKSLSQEHLKVAKSTPIVVSKMVKESTDFIIASMTASMEKLQKESMEQVMKHYEEMKQQNDDHLFEILTGICAAKEKVLAKSCDDAQKYQTSILSELDNLKKFVEDKLEENSELLTPFPNPLYCSTPKPQHSRVMDNSLTPPVRTTSNTLMSSYPRKRRYLVSPED